MGPVVNRGINFMGQEEGRGERLTKEVIMTHSISYFTLRFSQKLYKGQVNIKVKFS